MRVLVTGGSGFIGTNLVQSLIDDRHTVLNFDVAIPRNDRHIEFFRDIDILDVQKLNCAVADFQPEIIYHMAARTDLDGKSVGEYEANTLGVENLVKSFSYCKSLKLVIFASSRLVCEIGYQPHGELDYCPTTAYGESKVTGEKIVRKHDLEIPCPWIIVRPTSIWGPWFDAPYKNFFLSIAGGYYVNPKVKSIQKSFGFVGNTIFQLRKMMESNAQEIYKKTIYLGDYPPIDVIKMSQEIQRALGARPIIGVPVACLKVMALAGDFLKLIGYKNPPLTSFRLNNLLTPMLHDLAPLESVVGDLPYNMHNGVNITVDWLRNEGVVN
jgi:nucleoside-diphosphate-sugar epimerase